MLHGTGLRQIVVQAADGKGFLLNGIQFQHNRLHHCFCFQAHSNRKGIGIRGFRQQIRYPDGFPRRCRLIAAILRFHFIGSTRLGCLQAKGYGILIHLHRLFHTGGRGFSEGHVLLQIIFPYIPAVGKFPVPILMNG